jgi:hypothetical protein
MPRFGTEEPRIFTPPLRDLTQPNATLGHSVISFAHEVVRMELLPWQQWLLIHLLELRDDGTLRFRNALILVARQNGKSTISQVLALWFMYVYGAAMVIGTAQDLDVAEEIWQGAVDLVEETPELDSLKESIIRVNGKKALVLKSGERYKVKAANRRAGRGLSGDVILLDELREHQSWDAWGAITKTTMARSMALVLALSNAGDATSIVLRYLRNHGARLAVGDPDGINADGPDRGSSAGPRRRVAWSSRRTTTRWRSSSGLLLRLLDPRPQRVGTGQPVAGLHDHRANHRLGKRTDPEWIFRTEVLCQWSEGTLEGPFPLGSWEASADAEGAPVALCVETSWDRSYTYVGLATTRADGLAHIEVIAQRGGVEWVAGWLTAPERSQVVREAPVAVQAKGAPASSLIEDLRAAGVNVVEWGGADLPNGTGAFYDRVRLALGIPSESPTTTTGLRHRNDSVLNLSAATTVPRLTESGAFVWDRKKSVAASPLISVTGALWCLTSGMPTAPATSAYESRGVLTV